WGGRGRGTPGGRPGRGAGEGEWALGASAGFARGAGEGGSLLLRDRHNLWPLLLKITARKAAGLTQREGRQKRGGGAVRGESALAATGDASAAAGLDQGPGAGLAPEFAAQVADQGPRLPDPVGSPAL